MFITRRRGRYPSGTIYSPSLNEDEDFHPLFTAREFMKDIQNILIYPNINSPAQSEAYQLIVTYPKEYERRVREDAARRTPEEHDKRARRLGCLGPVDYLANLSYKEKGAWYEPHVTMLDHLDEEEEGRTVQITPRYLGLKLRTTTTYKFCCFRSEVGT